MINSNNYLSREESTAIKGLMIFLIILGHNAVLTKSVESIMPFLYLFHVKIFFILPFLYKTKLASVKESISKNFIRLYYPFIIFFIILSILYYFLNSSINDPNKLAKYLKGITDNEFLFFCNSLVTGNSYLIDYFTGYQFLWFLPVMFSLNIIKNYIDDKNISKTILLILGSVLFIFIYSVPTTPELTQVRYKLMLFSPFAIFQGIAMYFLGYVCSFNLLNKKSCNITIKLSYFIFAILSIVIIYNLTINPHYIKDNNIGAFYRFIIPFLAMSVIYGLRKKISKIGVLKKLGEISFPLYIFSTLICTVFYLIFKKFDAITPINGIIAQILIVLVSYYFVKILQKIPFVYKKMFPKSVSDLDLRFWKK